MLQSSDMFPQKATCLAEVYKQKYSLLSILILLLHLALVRQQLEHCVHSLALLFKKELDQSKVNL